MNLVFKRWIFCAYDQEHGCILRTYADIPKNHLSSNAGLFAQANRRMGVFCVRRQIFVIMILIVQR